MTEPLIQTSEVAMQQLSSEVADKLEQGKYSINVIGKGENKTILLRTPLEDVQDAEPQSDQILKRKIHRFYLVSQQSGLATLDILDSVLTTDGQTQESPERLREAELLNLAEKYDSRTHDSSHARAGLHPSDAGNSEFTLWVADAGFRVNSTTDSVRFVEAVQANKLETKTPPPGDEQKELKEAALQEVLKFM